MKALVTGGAGFIGSHLVDKLISRGNEVFIIDNLSTGSVNNIHPLATLYKIDICDKAVKEIFLKIKPDVVFHLAAQADVTQSVLYPGYDANVNIIGTINILEACREAKVKKLIFASTSAVYGEVQNELITEQNMVSPISYYGLSKLTAESYIRQYYKLYQLPYTIFRYANVYGPRQISKGEGGVVAIFIEKLKGEEPLNVYGDGEQTRDFIYVSDIVDANVLAIEKGNQETIQLSTGQKTSVNQLIQLLKEIHGSSMNIIYKEAKPGDIKHSCLDNSKAKQVLNWSPSNQINEGLKNTYY
jgi:UDP-glucose 4-epimerase